MGKRRGGGRLPKRDEVVGTAVLPVIRFPHSCCLTANEKDFSRSLEMTIRGKRHTPSILHKESAEGQGVGSRHELKRHVRCFLVSSINNSLFFEIPIKKIPHTKRASLCAESSFMGL